MSQQQISKCGPFPGFPRCIKCPAVKRSKNKNKMFFPTESRLDELSEWSERISAAGFICVERWWWWWSLWWTLSERQKEPDGRGSIANTRLAQWIYSHREAALIFYRAPSAGQYWDREGGCASQRHLLVHCCTLIRSKQN